MKPPGISLGLTPGGSLSMGVRHPSRAEDQVWEAVQEALNEGWTPERFKREAAQAWEHELKERARHEPQELLK